MKKIIVFLFLVTVISISLNNEEEVIIPSESIRFRIVANSNEAFDQMIKLNVKEELSEIISNIEVTSNNINDSREKIIESIPLMENKLEELDLEYDINYGNNYFPIKSFKGVTYNDGNYESLVITLGTGLGENWWCLLFPPLCLIDEEEYTDKEYSLYIKNIIDKFN